ncbi:ABATE domain-containing protein [Paenibacillus sp. JCM 10914]|uniref:CGNR zinc finger domain-containing protein n=1 Tax=Paenibacillus sp. JCM 10914 TaxID=1236974 RepID=UPI0003CC8983|nr:CGNR zinc finger domain-containing protein [Paenibacillus sp. JCM 10914]GAE07393.1 hypothetical protein JCM10914_3620 [Paenibacillus sp. JCM 10914]
MIWDDFLNSEWHDWRGTGKYEDRLLNPDHLHSFMNQYHFQVKLPLNSEEIHELQQLRSFLREFVQYIVAGGRTFGERIEELNHWMSAGPVLRELHKNEDGGYTLNYSTVHPGLTGVVADIAASFAKTLSEGEFARMRICANPDCLWIYYDDTRNRSKRYCDDKMCGNLMKVRRFRAKKKNLSSDRH